MAKRTYTVYDSRDDSIIAIDCTNKECAALMGIKIGTFYKYLSHFKAGRMASHWEIFPQEYFEDASEPLSIGST